MYWIEGRRRHAGPLLGFLSLLAPGLGQSSGAIVTRSPSSASDKVI